MLFLSFCKNKIIITIKNAIPIGLVKNINAKFIPEKTINAICFYLNTIYLEPEYIM